MSLLLTLPIYLPTPLHTQDVFLVCFDMAAPSSFESVMNKVNTE